MPEPTTPTGDDGKFVYEIKDGNLLIDGEYIDRISPPMSAEEAAKQPEEEEPAKTEAPPKEEEPAKVESKPAEPPPAEPPKPEKKKFKLKVYGEEVEKEFDDSELISTLQKGLAADKRFQEVSAKEREMEPFLRIKESAEFKTWLNDMVQSGQIEAPAPAPPPSPEDVMGYRLRTEEPEFDVIRTAMNDWSVTLPIYERQELERNHRVFNMAYDRFKAARGTKAPPKPEEVKPPVQPKEVVEAVLATKERIKENARSEKPGVQPEETDRVRDIRQREAVLRKRMRQGDRNAEYELAKLLYVDEMG